MSRFQPLTEFQGDGARSYALLPIRFMRLPRERTLVTNMVGEGRVLANKTFEALVQGDLDASDPDYGRLRAAHMLREDGDASPLELLALKTRTRYERLRNFTGLHIFVVSLRCDHSCPYCQVSRQSSDRNAYDMTEATAAKALDLVFRSPNPSLKIEFQGGEPLLNFDLVRQIVSMAQERNRREQRNLQFVIATTLSLATPDALEFCRDNQILLSTSLDGPRNLHNSNRPRPGRDSHERLEAGLRRARDIVGVDAVSALMTTSPASLNRVTEIVDEYLRLGFEGIFLRHLSPYGFAIKTKSYQAYNAERWLDFYREGLDYILEINRRGIRFTEHYAALLLTKMFTSSDHGFVDLMNPAGIGIAGVVYNYDGDVFASDESRMLKEMGDTTFRLGNVHQDTYESIFTSEQLLSALEESFTESAPMCSDCAFEPWCGAEPVFHHATFGDMLGRKPESEFCKRTMGVIHTLLEKLENPADAQILRDWVRPC